MTEHFHYNLLSHNTFGISAVCDRFLEYATEDDALEVASILSKSGSPYLLLGGGSNLLLTDDYHGIVVHSALKGITISSHVGDGKSILVRAASGENWDSFVEYCVENRLYGLENLSAIPGEVGASAVQNIGAYGVEAKDAIVSVEAVDITSQQKVVIPAEDCEYSYRQSKFKQAWKNKYLITAVTFRLSSVFEPKLDYGNIRTSLKERNIETPTARQLREVVISIREAKLPNVHEEGNAGSFFMNPVVTREKYEALACLYPQMPHYTIDDEHEKIPAGWMIEHCGWKGKTLGRAGVYAKQALVLVNRGGATGQEVVALCRAIQQDVHDQFGIDITPEVNIY